MDALLSELGFNAYERSVIAQLSTVDTSRATTLVQRSGVPQGRIYAILEGLRAKGIVRVVPTTPKRYAIDDLRTALTQHVQRTEADLKRTLERVRVIENPSRVRGERSDSHSVHILTGREEHTLAIATMADGARKEFAQIAPLFIGTFSSRAALLRAARRGVRVRVIVCAVTNRNRDRIKECVRTGIAVRTLKSPDLLSMVVRDAEEFLLGVQDYRAQEERLTLRSRNRAMLETLVHTFEQAWRKARPIA